MSHKKETLACGLSDRKTQKCYSNLESKWCGCRLNIGPPESALVHSGIMKGALARSRWEMWEDGSSISFRDLTYLVGYRCKNPNQQSRFSKS